LQRALAGNESPNSGNLEVCVALVLEHLCWRGGAHELNQERGRENW
jgi:hypothetical protein